jgi:YcxB-like protein
MDEPISASYRLTEADYIDVVVAQIRSARTSPVFRLGRWLFLGFVVVVTLVVTASVLGHPWLPPGPHRLYQLARLVILFCLWLLVYLAYHPRHVPNRFYYHRKFRAIPEGSLRIEWGCDRESLWSQTALASGSYRWELFRTIVETPECFLFYQGEQISLWLPGHAFSSPGDLRRFADLARSRVANYVVLGECQFPTKPEPVGLDEL